MRLGDTAAQLETVDRCVTDWPGLTAQDLQDLAHLCAKHCGPGPWTPPAALRVLLDTALRMLLADKRERNYAAVATVALLPLSMCMILPKVF